MKKRQIEFGKRMLKEIAEKWGTTIEQTALILQSKEQDHFYQWANATEFLEEKLYEENYDNGYGVVTEHDLD